MGGEVRASGGFVVRRLWQEFSVHAITMKKPKSAVKVVRYLEVEKIKLKFYFKEIFIKISPNNC